MSSFSIKYLFITGYKWEFRFGDKYHNPHKYKTCGSRFKAMNKRKPSVATPQAEDPHRP